PRTFPPALNVISPVAVVTEPFTAARIVTVAPWSEGFGEDMTVTVVAFKAMSSVSVTEVLAAKSPPAPYDAGIAERHRALRDAVTRSHRADGRSERQRRADVGRIR